MKLLRLQVQNLMALEALEVDFSPDGAVTIFQGQNNIGKSTALNSIAMALGGKKLCPDEPLRRGQTTGFVEVELGEFHPEGPLAELKVRRVFTESGERLVITDAEGVRSASPQALLDKLCAGIGFDPRAFATAAPKDQVSTLKALAGLDFSAIDAEYEVLYADRRETNRDLERLRKQLEGIDFDPLAPDEEIPASKLIEQLEAAKEANRSIQVGKDMLASLERHAAVMKEEVAERKAALQEAEELLAEAVSNLETSPFAEPEELIDEAPIKEALEKLDETNSRVRAKQRADEVSASISDLEGIVGTKNDRIVAIKAEKAAAISAAEFPVDGLSFDEDGVRYGGTLMSQLAFSESLRISTAIGLAMKPELPIVLIDQGSELDDAHLKMIAEMAAENGAQVVATKVSPAKTIEVHILDAQGEAIEQ